MGSQKSSSGLVPKLILSLAVALITVLLTGDFFLSIKPLKELELKQIDEKFNARGAVPFKDSTPNVIILEVTRNTFKGMPEQYKKWPYPREFFAKVIRNLNNAGVKAIGIDFLMESSNIFSPEDDSALVNAILEKNNVVIAGKTFDENRSAGGDVRIEVENLTEDYGNFLFPVDSSVGIVQVIADNDGVHRRYYPFAYSETSKRSVPTFSFAIMNKILGLPPLAMAELSEGYFKLGDKLIPRYDNVSMLVNLYGSSRTFPHVDFINVLDDSTFNTAEEIEYETALNIWDDPDSGLLYSGMFKDKIVLIGSTLEEDRDVIPVAFSTDERSGSNTIYGVEFHANVVQNIIEGNFISRFPVWLEILLTVIFVLISFFLTSYLRDLKFRMNWIVEIGSVVLIFLLVVGIRELSNFMFINQKLLFSYVGIDLGIILGYFSSTAYYFILERKQKTQIKGMFSRYVDKSMVDELIANPDKLRLGGEKKFVTVFFSDIAGFSTFSEKKEPEELVAFLNQYLSAMTETVLANKGTLDKYIGDAVMAFWGAPIPIENHAYLACKTALIQQAIIKKMQQKWKEEGQPLIDVRIGINTGDMVVGNVGGTQRFDYTVMGDNVNLASRLEGANKAYGTHIMISDSTHELVKDQFMTRELDRLVVKGKTQPVQVFELVAEVGDQLEESKMNSLKLYCDAMAKYRNRDFTGAVEIFKKVLEINPDDGPTKVYIERSTHYIDSPPDDNWDGVFRLTTK
jgi:adenylate cyclase